MSGCFLQRWGWGEIFPSSWPHSFSWHKESGKQLRWSLASSSRAIPLPMCRDRHTLWDGDPGQTGILGTSLHGLRPQAQLPSPLSCVKKLLISWLPYHVPPLPNKAALGEKGARSARGGGALGHPNTCCTPTAEQWGCSEGSTEGSWSPSSSHCPASCAGPERLEEVFLTQVRPPEEQQCLKPDSNFLLLSWHEFLLLTKA